MNNLAQKRALHELLQPYKRKIYSRNETERNRLLLRQILINSYYE